MLLAGCATLTPRFEQDVATSFATDEMRRLTTPELELYYPAAYSEQAHRVAARAAECLKALRAHQARGNDTQRVVLFLTSSNYNNAYVSGQTQGEPLHSLVPLTATDEFFHWQGLSGSDTGDIACHEMFHVAHFEQVKEFWWLFNLAFGPQFQPQFFLERWFTEGVAQYYEGRIQRPVGRPHSPPYRGAFDAFVASRHGELRGGDLSVSRRDLGPYSGAYLTGLHFIEYLVRAQGEARLWQLMDLQARSFWSPFGATLRFQQVYGKDVGELLDEWSAELQASAPRRERPASQRVLLPQLGQYARLGTHPASGALAVLTSGNEEVNTLRILGPDGEVRAERKLAQLAPIRDWVAANAYSVSGLSFSADGRSLFLLNDDLTARGDTRAQVVQLDVATLETVRVWSDLGRGLGGAVSADGSRYTFVEFPPEGGSRVVELALETGARRVWMEATAPVSLGSPTWSPDQARLAVARLDGNGWNLVLREADGSERWLTTDGAFNYAPRWADATHLVFARQHGDYLQVHRLDVDSGRMERLSDTAYGLLDVGPVPGGVAFVNREGTGWSLDRVQGEPLEVVQEVFPVPAEPGGLTAHQPAPLEVQEDRPYSGLDQLFVPQLRTPALSASLSRGALLVTTYASLLGRDRLGWHTWAINLGLDLPTLDNSISLGYRNLQLAPWALTALAGRDAFGGQAYWSAEVSAGRTVFTAPVAFGVRVEALQDLAGGTDRYLGPFVSLAWSAGESTGYGGLQRQLSASLDAAAFPAVLGSSRDLVDLRGTLAVGIPLPFSRRNSAVVSLVGRALLGAPTGALKVGGVSRGTALWESNPTRNDPGPGAFLPGSPVEAVRGYDDHATRATAVAVASARYRYSFIIDEGFTATLWLFPSLFFRQIDLEAFGVAAVTDNPLTRWSRAVGGAVWLRLLGGGALPISLYYQLAGRFDADAPLLHTLGFALE
jgi:Tol biopolymer transport system component